MSKEWINRERLVASFLEYVQIDSPTKSEKLFCDHLVRVMRDLGFAVHVDDAGTKVGSNSGNLIARLGASKEGLGMPMLLSCHMDTVSPGVGVKPVVRGSTIYSDGTTVLGGDDKAGIAAVIEALRVVRERGLDHGAIEVVFTIYEEGGLYGAKNLDYSRLEAKRCFVLDSSGDPGKVVTRGPSEDKFHFRVIGRPAHAGVAPEQGISAIQVAADAIARMKLLRVDAETTANIGRIEGGGATNVVTAEVTVTAEARSQSPEKLDAQSAHMVACFKEAAAKYGAEVEYKVDRLYHGFHIDANSEIVQDVFAAIRSTGIEPSTMSTGGGSDTNIFNANGITAVNLGIGERKAHTLEEHMHIDDLVQTAATALALIQLHARK